MDTGKSHFLFVASAGVFGAVAAAAGVGFEFEAIVLWFGVGGWFELDDKREPVAGREFGFADKNVAFLLEVDFVFSSNERNRLVFGRDGFEVGVVERNGGRAVLLEEELRFGISRFEEAAALGATQMLFVGGAGIQYEKRDQGESVERNA